VGGGAYGLSGFLGVQGEAGFQVLYLKDTGQVAVYGFAGAGRSVGTPGRGVGINPGVVWGHGVPTPAAYEGHFVNFSGAGSPVPFFGIQGSTASFPVSRGSAVPYPISGDPNAAWGPGAPTSYQLGPYVGFTTPGISGGISYQYYSLLGVFP